MRSKNIRIALEESEVQKLEEITKKGKNSARVIIRAQVLLMANEKGLNKKPVEIEEILRITQRTITNIKKRYKEGGIEKALYEKKRPGQPKRLTGKEEAEIVAIACSDAPKGYERWTITLITEEAIKRFKKKICRKTINKVLLENNTKPWLKKNVVYI